MVEVDAALEDPLNHRASRRHRDCIEVSRPRVVAYAQPTPISYLTPFGG
jgi:hypothetical protein